MSNPSLRGKRWRGLEPFVTGLKTQIPKRIRPIKYFHLSILCTRKHRPKWVNRFTKVSSKCDIINSKKVRKSNDLL